MTNKNSTGTVLSSYTITPNADSQVTGITEADGSTVTYGYDALGHLTSDVRTGTNAYSKSYTVDGEGNRTSMTVGGTSSTFNYNNDDWLTSTTGGLVTSYGYDNAGEQTSRTVGGVAYTLAYDYEGQLVSITHSTTTVSFTYDAEGRRMSRTSGGTTTSFYYDGGQVQLEAQGGTVTSVYSYGNSLTRKDGEFPMFDGHGSERTVANSSQTVTGTLNLDAFGVQAGSTGSSTDPYMYAATSGYRNDGDAGLSLVGARYYDASVGRFITRDTVLTQKPYCYCNGDPVNKLDPSGHGWIEKEIMGWLRYAKPVTQMGARNGIFGNILTIVGGLTYINGADPGTFGNDLAAAGGGYTTVAAVGTIWGGIALLGGTTAATIFGGIAIATGVGAVAVGIAVIVVAIGRNSGYL